MQFKARLVGPGPWGFRLTGGKENNQPLIISRTTAGGKAVKADIKPDDILTAINGEPTFDMTLARAQEKIRLINGDLYLTMMRRGIDGPPQSPPQHQVQHQAPQHQQARSIPPAPPMPYQQQARSPTSYSSPPVRAPAVRSPNQANYTRPPQPFGQARPTGLPQSSSSFKPVTSPKSGKQPFTYGYDPSSARSPGYRPLMSPSDDSGPRVEIRREPQYQPHHQPVKMPSYYRRIDPTHGSGADDQFEKPHPSPSAKVVHLQYNSPVGIYSADNIADSFKGQASELLSAGQAGVVKGNSPGYSSAGYSSPGYGPAHARKSPGYSPSPAHASKSPGYSPSPAHASNSPGYKGQSPQSYNTVHDGRSVMPRYVDASAKFIPQRDEDEGDYYGYKNPGSQSKSFRALQHHVALGGDDMEYGQEL